MKYLLTTCLLFLTAIAAAQTEYTIPTVQGTTNEVAGVKLELVGGYRLPWYSTRWNPDAKRSTGFPQGCMAAYQFDDKFVIWHENGRQGNQLLTSETTEPMGTGADPYQWPILKEGRIYNESELFSGQQLDSHIMPQGFVFDPARSKLWVSLRSYYATGKDFTPWITSIDYPSGDVSDFRPKVEGSLMRRYGGGMTLVPESVAKKFFDGERAAFASGGLTSGQGGGAGPALGVFFPEEERIEQLMYYASTSELGSQSEAVKAKSERGFADYFVTSGGWILPPDEGGGYFGSNDVKGGGAWIEVDGKHVFLSMAIAPTGEVNYAFQTTNLSRTRENNLYGYTGEQLETLITTDAEPWSQRGDFIRWDENVNGGLKQLAYCLSWDEKNEVLLMLYPGGWKYQPYHTESHPVVAAYKVSLVNSEPTPEPTPTPPPEPQPEPDDTTAQLEKLLIRVASLEEQANHGVRAREIQRQQIAELKARIAGAAEALSSRGQQ